MIWLSHTLDLSFELVPWFHAPRLHIVSQRPAFLGPYPSDPPLPPADESRAPILIQHTFRRKSKQTGIDRTTTRMYAWVELGSMLRVS